MELDDRAALVTEMLAASALSDAEIEQRFRDALDADYWRALCPDCGVERDSLQGAADVRALSDADIAQATETFRADGYINIAQLLAPPLVDRMRTIVERLRAAGWPPVFAFVYDECWALCRHPAIERLLSALVGRGYRQNSVIWTYYIAPRDGASGWSPHVEGNGEGRLTVWIPLTDATVDNGCMYIIPRRHVPASLPCQYRQWTNVERAQLEGLLQGTRALPARAGSFLGWSHDVVHWGSIAKGASTPRISIAVEFAAASEQAIRWEQPTFTGDQMPTLAERLGAVGKCLARYSVFEPVMARYAALAARLYAT